MQRSLEPWSEVSSVCFCGVALTPRQGTSCSLGQPQGNEMGLLLGLCMFFPCSKNTLFSSDCWSVHSLLPSLTFKTGQIVGIWWINHDQSAIVSLKHWNLLSLVVGRTANSKSPVTCGLIFFHFWASFSYSVNQRFVCLPSPTSWIHELSLSISLCPPRWRGIEGDKKVRKG